MAPAGGGSWRLPLFAVVVTALLPAVAAKVCLPPPHTRPPTPSPALSSPPLAPLAGAVQHVQVVTGSLVLCAGADCILFWGLCLYRAVRAARAACLPACLSCLQLYISCLLACALEPPSPQMVENATCMPCNHRRLAGGTCSRAEAEARCVPTHFLYSVAALITRLTFVCSAVEGLQPTLREKWQMPGGNLQMRWRVQPTRRRQPVQQLRRLLER
jgi:hypothetical protein